MRGEEAQEEAQEEGGGPYNRPSLTPVCHTGLVISQTFCDFSDLSLRSEGNFDIYI